MKRRIVLYKNLLDIRAQELNEPLVSLGKTVISFAYRDPLKDMKKIFGNSILVRTSVLQRLILAQKKLQITDPSLNLLVTYGYRSPEIQTFYFQRELSKISKEQFFSDPHDLYESVHKRIAVPMVAGHPTGGAVDIIIVGKGGKDVDFGSDLYDLSNPNSEFFSDTILDRARQNRLLLREIMMAAGFAPFDGEWWHFSYGDKEWAYYYKKRFAIYKQLSTEEVFPQLRTVAHSS